ncbi:MAG: beta-galactosidase [Phycisphaerales bacterium]
MPSVTHDGRSFMVDGKRVWLVSGRVPYARIPRSHWADRIAAAKNAGLNTIETPIFWNRHEVRSGRFDFTGENDLRHFVDLIGKAGMYCILGIGPYVGADWDMGGLPSFLHELQPREGVPIAYRTNNQQFLEACSRFIGNVADQIRGWQVTAAGTGGPIILIQCESEWTCGDDTKAAQYLGELTRYIRESGLSVPIVNSNDLWQQIEGQIDGWSGSENMLATMRQLIGVRSGQPRLVIDFATGHQSVWGREPFPVMAPRSVERRLAELLIGGGQYNLTTFCGGINPGFYAGRTDDGIDTFATHAADSGCAIDQTGTTTELYSAIRRVSFLGSKFGRVFSHLDPAYKPVVAKPIDPNAQVEEAKPAKKSKNAPPSVSVVHAIGTQGGAAFVFGPEEEHDHNLGTTLLLGDGTELPVPLGDQTFACCLLDVNVAPRGHVDYCNLTPLTVVSNTIVLYGPAGSKGMLSINGSPLEVDVPSDETPAILQHEGMCVILIRTQDTDQVAFSDDAIYLGASGMSATGQPILANGVKQINRINAADGKSKPVQVEPAKRIRADKIEHTPWTAADQLDYVEGNSARFAGIQAFTDLTTLGVPSGYGWYRFALNNDKAAKVTLDFGTGGDRFHLFSDGKPVAVLGVGPGADDSKDLSLKKGEQRLVILAENLGRFSSGMNLGEEKGLIDDLYVVEDLALSKPTLKHGTPIPLLSFKTPLWDVAEGDATTSERMVMTFKHTGDAEVLLHIAHPPSAGLLILNDKPIKYLDRSGPACIVLPEDRLKQGVNTLELTVVNHDQVEHELPAAAKSMRLALVDSGLANAAELAFAKWEPPTATSFMPLAKAKPGMGMPLWLRCEFDAPKSLFNASNPGVATRGIFLEPDGLTKGQFFLNGRHVGRYFVATKQGKPVPPQSRYYIPPSFLREGTNELTIFDEHGHSPSRVRLVLA